MTQVEEVELGNGPITVGAMREGIDEQAVLDRSRQALDEALVIAETTRRVVEQSLAILRRAKAYLPSRSWTPK